MRKKTVSSILAVLFLFSTYSLTLGAEVIKLKFANYSPPMHMNSTIMAKYCEELNKKLAGKVEITHYTGGTLLNGPKMAAGVSTGIADIGLSHTAYSRGRFPASEIFELPIGIPSGWVGTRVANDFHNKFNLKEWDAYHPLMFSTSPPNVLQTISKQVRTLDDLRGMKIRGTGRVGDIVKNLGAVPIPVETPDLYEGMKRGVCEGSFLPLEVLKSLKIAEIEKYVTATWKIGAANAFYVVMNKQKWNSLHPDVQKIISDFSADFIPGWGVEWNKVDIEGRDFFTKLGGKVISLSDAESARWVSAIEPMFGDFKKDLVSKGFTAGEVDNMIRYVKERIDYWKAQEKVQKVPTAYQY